MYEQWKKAVVHLECATDSDNIYLKWKKDEELQEKLDKGEISYEEYREGSKSKTRDIRFHGTAIFVVHNEKYYLLTARHVLFDERQAKVELQERERIREKMPEPFGSIFFNEEMKRSSNYIFKIIFRVPSLDEAISGIEQGGHDFLSHLAAGVSYMHPYTFSPPELDLAIISLRKELRGFADRLISLGYSPISSELIADGPSSEGAEVFTVGFPSATSLVTQVMQHPSDVPWSSGFLSLPVFSWGRVSMLHEQLPFYWCDMSIYPGNSGGPVIEKGKLVGIVSAQATLPLEGAPMTRTRIPFGKIIKTNFVKALLDEQEVKDLRQ